tara:strand:- start:215 stop:1144 length:930 start_codon:yes stop_codon:yes gene_type:complete
MRYVDLFCGAGGTSCGLAQAGWECVGAVDADAHALATYALNFPSHPTVRHDLALPLDAALVAAWRLHAGDDGVLAGSSPCTDFSSANPAPRDRAQLTVAFAEHAVRLRPAWVLFENVPRARHFTEFRMLVEALGAAGYGVHHGIVNALGAGVAQTRRRLILVAARGDQGGDGGAARAVWERFAASLTAAPPSMAQCFAASALPCPVPYLYLQSCNEKWRKSIFSVDGPAPTVRCIIRPFRATYTFTPRDDCHDASQIFSATVAHLAALQGFPPTFRWDVGGKTAAARAVGNAVPPPLASRLAEAVTALR